MRHLSTELNTNVRHQRRSWRKRSFLGITALWLTFGLASGFIIKNIIDQLNDAKVESHHTVQLLSRMSSAHDRFEISMSDQIIVSLLDHVSPEVFNGNLEGPRRAAFQKILNDHWTRLPGVASFTLINEKGIRQFGVVNKNFTNLSDREYFQVLRDGGTLYVSAAENSRASGKDGIHVARAYRTKDGKFQGVVVMNLSMADIFAPFYKSLNLPNGYHVELRSLHKDLHRRLIATPQGAALGKVPTDEITSIIQELQKTESSHWSGNISLSGKMNTLSVSRLEGTDLWSIAVVPEGVAIKAAVNAAWLAVFTLIAAFFGVVMASRSMVRSLEDQLALQTAYANMRTMAIRDRLTGLPNRAYLEENFESFCEGIYKQGKVPMLAFIDLDGFKRVNDQLGHETGDDMLKQAALKLQASAGAEALCARLGGDEFVAIIPGDGQVETCTQQLNTLVQEFTKPYQLAGLNIKGGCSVGGARMGIDGLQWAELSRKADAAMYYCKRSGRSQAKLYEEPQK